MEKIKKFLPKGGILAAFMAMAIVLFMASSPEAASPSLSATSVSVNKGKDAYITAKNGKIKSVSSSNTSVLTVAKKSDTKVKLHGKAYGNAKVTVKTTSGKSLTCQVKVRAMSKTSVSIKQGSTYTLSVNDSSAKWSSSNTSVASVSSKGVVTANRKGSATITAKAGGTSFTCKVTVTDAKYQISVDKAAPKLDSRAAKAFNALNFKITVDSSVSYAGKFDAATQSITLRAEGEDVYHELGHFIAFVAGNVDTTTDFKSIYSAEKGNFPTCRRAYASQSPSEYFAEAYREYVMRPSGLKSACPKTYAYVKNTLPKITDAQVERVKAVYGRAWTF